LKNKEIIEIDTTESTIRIIKAFVCGRGASRRPNNFQGYA